MDRASIYILQDKERNTFEYDDELPALPLPELHVTLKRYYETLKPFGTKEELENSRRIIEEFQNGIGKSLHAKLKERSIQMKNWLGDWWDKYAYHTIRIPLYPYTVMAMPLKLESLNIPENEEHALKNLARILYHTLEFWDLLRKGKLKPLSSHGGSVKYSSNLYRNFLSTSRIPGLEIDHIESYFKTISEGKTPSHAIIIGKGRIFMFNGVIDNDKILIPQDLLIIIQRIRAIIDYEAIGDCVPILTHDERTSWAKNRQHLLELSVRNRKVLHLIESSSTIVILDENEPKDYEEVSRLAISGDYHSLWADRSSVFIAFKNGKFACIGEHSCYDGTISVSFATFLQLSLLEAPEPNWSSGNSNNNNNDKKRNYVHLEELIFDIDDYLKTQINKVEEDCKKRRQDVLVTHKVFHGYGKDFMKNCELHPDSFIQVAMQIAYTEMHKEIVPIYETALMRQYYNGRTETLRSCTVEVYKLLKMVLASQSYASFNSAQFNQAFRKAVQHHNQLMTEARNGYGVDRHLFGLWCVAHLNKIEVPNLYTDPLYIKSGGGGNFILSTSTLGYTMNVGFVAPMLLDGYGVFYTITPQCVYMQVSAYRGSSKTSAHKFNQQIFSTLHRIKQFLNESLDSKL